MRDVGAARARRSNEVARWESKTTYRKRRDYVIPTLRAMPGVRCEEPGGAFYAYPNIGAFLGKNGINTPLDFSAALLEQAHVAVVPSEAFGTSEHVRISYATSMHEIDRPRDA